MITSNYYLHHFQLSAHMYQSHSYQTAFCEIACLEFLARFVGILILVKTGQNHKTDILCADLHLIMTYCQY